jgi:hypothetical protein
MADIQTQLPVRITDGTNTVGITGSALQVDITASTGTLASNITEIAGVAVVAAAPGVIKVGISDSAGASITLGPALMAASVPVTIASNQSPVSTTTNLTDVGGSPVALGQAAMAASIPVVIASDQTAVPTNIAEYGGTPTTLGQKAMAASIPVVIASDQTAVPVTVSGTSAVNLTDVGGSPIALGQALMAASLPVVIASDQTTLPVTEGEVATGIVTSFQTASAVANGSTGTLTYTVTAGKTLYLKEIIASASGGPTRVQVDYGVGPTIICVGFTSTAQPNYIVTFAQPVAIPAATAVNIKIMNNAGAAQDVYGTFIGHEV